MSFKLPIKTDWMALQMAHEPTREYAEEIYRVTKRHGYDLALEIGAAWGVSALAILTAGKGDLISVDVQPETKAVTEVAANGLDNRWQYVSNSSDGYFAVAIARELKFDLVYIDGSHKYANVHADVFNGWTVLKPGGILIADDYIHPANNRTDNEGKVEYGVSLALWELVYEKKIKRVGTSKHLFWAVKR